MAILYRIKKTAKKDGHSFGFMPRTGGEWIRSDKSDNDILELPEKRIDNLIQKLSSRELGNYYNYQKVPVDLT